MTQGLETDGSRCRCGSAIAPHIIYDARGIPLGLVCDECEDKLKSKYRKDVLEDSDYECYEQIEPD